MIGFTDALITEQIGHQRWKVVKPFRFISATGIEVDIPAGFQTDLASVPAITQGIVSKVGYWSQAAVVHDLLYFNHRHGLDVSISRNDADKLLLEGCKIKAVEFGVSDSERRDWLIYGAVVVGGLESWETGEERKARLAQFDNSDIID